MAHRRTGITLKAPRVVTVLASLALVLVAVLSLRFHLPVGHGFVAQHRFWIAIAGYGVLALGALLPML